MLKKKTKKRHTHKLECRKERHNIPQGSIVKLRKSQFLTLLLWDSKIAKLKKNKKQSTVNWNCESKPPAKTSISFYFMKILSMNFNNYCFVFVNNYLFIFSFYYILSQLNGRVPQKAIVHWLFCSLRPLQNSPMFSIDNWRRSTENWYC